MNRINYILYMIAITLLGTGCTENYPVDASQRGEGEIVVQTRIEGTAVGGVTTRGAGAVTDAGAVLQGASFFVNHTKDWVDPDRVSVPDYAGLMTGATAYKGNRQANGIIQFDSPVPMYDKKMSYYANVVGCYPSPATIDEGVSATWDLSSGNMDLLLSNPWCAGKYTTPSPESGLLTFNHCLSYLKVVCQAASGENLTLVRASWGKIKSIEVLECASEATYSLADAALTFGSEKKDIKLSDATCATAFTDTDISASGSTTPIAAAMIAPRSYPLQTKFAITLRVTAAGVTADPADDIVRSVVVPITAVTAGGMLAGKVYTVSLAFRAEDLNVSVLTVTTDDGWTQPVVPDETVGSTQVKVGDYVYEDGSFSTALDESRKDKAVGLVFWVEPGTNHFKVVSKEEHSGFWSTSKFEISPTEEQRYGEDGWKNTALMFRSGMTVEAPAFQTCYDRNSYGIGWYLPARNEMQYIACAYNGVAPNVWDTSPSPALSGTATRTAWDSKFTAISGTPFTTDFDEYYWTSTEMDKNNAYVMTNFNSGNMTFAGKADYRLYRGRCVREYGRPSVGDYYYRDGSSSEVLQSDKTVVGMIFWVDYDNPKHFKIMSLDMAQKQWSGLLFAGNATSDDDGKVNQDAAKVAGNGNFETIYTAMAWCDAKTLGGSGWYLPAKNELKGIWWSVNRIFHGDSYEWASGDDIAATAWNNRLTAAGGVAHANALTYWSSTEVDNELAISLSPDEYSPMLSVFTNVNKVANTYNVRCIKEIGK